MQNKIFLYFTTYSTNKTPSFCLINNNILTEAVQHPAGYCMGAEDFKDGKQRWTNDSSKLRYSHWNGYEPSNSGGVEHCAHFWKYANFRWNDAPCYNSNGMGYICEKTQVRKIALIKHY